jgi:hypothetical protein
MYTQGSGQNKFHVQTYGHPSKVGFKDICNLWKAEKWDPEKLIALYRRAGAKYFVALANHHCNFDCYASKYQPWNSVAIGPKKDIVGGWATAARKAGLRFGVTVHAARSWNWYEVAQGADATGPMQGIAYDGKLTKADGKGQWWEGLDPQDLYAQNHRPGEKPSPAYCEKFFQRTLDLIDSYQPDLLYFDDGVLPLTGRRRRRRIKIASAVDEGRLPACRNAKTSAIPTETLPCRACEEAGSPAGLPSAKWRPLLQPPCSFPAPRWAETAESAPMIESASGPSALDIARRCCWTSCPRTRGSSPSATVTSLGPRISASGKTLPGRCSRTITNSWSGRTSTP